MSLVDNSYRIMPAISKTRSLDIYYGSDTTMTFNGRAFPKRYGIDVQLYDYGGGNNQKWVFEKVNYGNGGAYRSKGYGVPPNCFGYAMFADSESGGVSFYLWDTSHKTEDYSDRFKSAIEKYAVSCHRISDDTASIAANEYRVAVRAPRENGYNYHVIYQLSDGSWAGKDYDDKSESLGWGNPSTSPGIWSDGYYASCGTIYFAVRRW